MIKIARLTFITNNKFQKRDSEKLRGFFGNLYRKEDLFHNHNPDNKSIYRMPLIQYKVLNGYLSIFGINEALSVITDKFLKTKELIIGNNVITSFETNLEIYEANMYVDNELHDYLFETLWLPINQKNYKDFINKKLNLNMVLQNHILTNFKGFEIKAEKKIMVKGNFNETSVYINNIEYFGFTGNFICNVILPEYLSLGQMRSIGFGCVKKNIDN